MLTTFACTRCGAPVASMTEMGQRCPKPSPAYAKLPNLDPPPGHSLGVGDYMTLLLADPANRADGATAQSAGSPPSG